MCRINSDHLENPIQAALTGYTGRKGKIMFSYELEEAEKVVNVNKLIEHLEVTANNGKLLSGSMCDILKNVIAYGVEKHNYSCQQLAEYLMDMFDFTCGEAAYFISDEYIDKYTKQYKDEYIKEQED